MQLAQPDERSRLRAFAQALLAVADKHATQAKSLRRGSARYLGSMEEDEDDLCAICYAAPNTARLMPCQVSFGAKDRRKLSATQVSEAKP